MGPDLKGNIVQVLIRAKIGSIICGVLNNFFRDLGLVPFPPLPLSPALVWQARLTPKVSQPLLCVTTVTQKIILFSCWEKLWEVFLGPFALVLEDYNHMWKI